MVPNAGGPVKGLGSRGTVDPVLRRLLLLAIVVGVAAAARQLLLTRNGPGTVGSPDHWPPVPRKPSDA